MAENPYELTDALRNLTGMLTVLHTAGAPVEPHTLGPIIDYTEITTKLAESKERELVELHELLERAVAASADGRPN